MDLTSGSNWARPRSPAFAECSGLSFTTDPVEYREGTDKPVHARKLTGIHKFSNLTLKRGMTQNVDLFKWYEPYRWGSRAARWIGRAHG